MNILFVDISTKSNAFSPSLLAGHQAVVMVLESKGDTAVKMMCKLLQAFWKIGLVTVDQMNRVRPLTHQKVAPNSLVALAHKITNL